MPSSSCRASVRVVPRWVAMAAHASIGERSGASFDRSSSGAGRDDHDARANVGCAGARSGRLPRDRHGSAAARCTYRSLPVTLPSTKTCLAHGDRTIASQRSGPPRCVTPHRTAPARGSHSSRSRARARATMAHVDTQTHGIERPRESPSQARTCRRERGSVSAGRRRPRRSRSPPPRSTCQATTIAFFIGARGAAARRCARRAALAVGHCGLREEADLPKSGRDGEGR